MLEIMIRDVVKDFHHTNRKKEPIKDSEMQHRALGQLQVSPSNSSMLSDYMQKPEVPSALILLRDFTTR